MPAAFTLNESAMTTSMRSQDPDINTLDEDELGVLTRANTRRNGKKNIFRRGLGRLKGLHIHLRSGSVDANGEEAEAEEENIVSSSRNHFPNDRESLENHAQPISEQSFFSISEASIRSQTLTAAPTGSAATTATISTKPPHSSRVSFSQTITVLKPSQVNGDIPTIIERRDHPERTGKCFGSLRAAELCRSARLSTTPLGATPLQETTRSEFRADDIPADLYSPMPTSPSNDSSSPTAIAKHFSAKHSNKLFNKFNKFGRRKSSHLPRAETMVYVNVRSNSTPPIGGNSDQQAYKAKNSRTRSAGTDKRHGKWKTFEEDAHQGEAKTPSIQCPSKKQKNRLKVPVAHSLVTPTRQGGYISGKETSSTTCDAVQNSKELARRSKKNAEKPTTRVFRKSDLQRPESSTNIQPKQGQSKEPEIHQLLTSCRGPPPLQFSTL